MSEKGEWVMSPNGRNAAMYTSAHRWVDAELTHEELCVATVENYRGAGDNTSAFIPLPVLIELMRALGYQVTGPVL